MASKERIGEAVVRLGLASQDSVASALEHQQSREKNGAAHVPLGALLIEMGLLAPAQLVGVLEDRGLQGFQLSEDAVRLAASFPRTMADTDRVIMFASATSGPESASIAAQTALALALMGEGPLLLIDADLREPTLHDRFGMPATPGLVELIDGSASSEQAIRPSGLPELKILCAGSAKGDLLVRLLSERCEALVNEFRASYRYVILTAPAVLEHPEPILLGSRADGAILVVRAEREGMSEVNDACRMLRGLKAKIHGTVLAQPAKRKAGGRRK
ncbi:MAG: hypothetical protein H6812_04715 [Phycisphaeraceae bacterium]|nr:hypothetical protein [Phycisphaerales bacterium]MCB9842541.1 hypothetical protein [Phycisphaeraceae bacterium]